MISRSRTILPLLTLALMRSAVAADPKPFHFAILGDRTGSAQPGVFEQVLRETTAESPDFVVTVGDLIEGLRDDTAAAQWQDVQRILSPFKRYPLYLVPGNHDIWSPESERLFRQHSGHPPHYGFDYGNAHLTVLDNSRTETLPPEELTFLDEDLRTHAAQPVKFVISHRPSWLIDVAGRNSNAALHRLARQYGVQFVVAGHVHQLIHMELDGVTYLSMPSSAGHLRGTLEYRDGWFFGHALVQVAGSKIDLTIKELAAPHGQGRITRLADWGMTGLNEKPKAQRAAGGSRSIGMPAR